MADLDATNVADLGGSWELVSALYVDQVPGTDAALVANFSATDVEPDDSGAALAPGDDVALVTAAFEPAGPGTIETPDDPQRFDGGNAGCAGGGSGGAPLATLLLMLALVGWRRRQTA